MTKGLLIVDRMQYGYLTDSLKWSRNLAGEMPVHYVCFDYGHKRFDTPGVDVHYVSRRGVKQLRAVKLLASGLLRIAMHRGPVAVQYFPKCHLLKKLMPWRRMHIDIRTMSIFRDPAARRAMDDDIRRCCRMFDTVSAISPGVAESIGRPDIAILPLGADVISTAPKNYTDGIRMLYVGTFGGRRIEDTVRGACMFAKSHPDVPLSYDLYGSGDPSEDAAVEAAIAEAEAQGVRGIKWHGRKSHDELVGAFDRANAGICYVPITDYYQNQPPTKTYEYAMSGLVTLGTATKANAEIITDRNGVLIADNPEAVAKGLEEFWRRRNEFDETAVRESLSDYSWTSICANQLKQAFGLK